ncbi:hypothetical protein B0H11DRAFT_1966563 [Mycena galericulata]|nr:hypothetical protein B0H11DRAFT_1966563 [Mycena galericulata]
MESTCKDECPHHPSTAHDPDSGKALRQHAAVQANDPSRPTPIIPDHVAFQGMSAETQKEVCENPGDYLTGTIFCGGATLFDKYTNLRGHVANAIDQLVGPGLVTVIKPQATVPDKKPRRGPRGTGKVDKFASPIVLLLRVSNPVARAILIDQATLAADYLLALHATPLNPALLSWAIGFFKTDIVGPPDLVGSRLCWAVYKALTQATPLPKAARLIDCLTQGQDGSALSRDQRMPNWAMTLDFRHIPHAENPVIVLFAKPCTKNAAAWDEVRSELRTVYTDLLEAFTPHANAAAGHNLCADCKLDCHPKYNCAFTARDRGWWGPKGLEFLLRILRGGGDSDSEGEARGSPRARTSNSSSSRGRGGRC